MKTRDAARLTAVDLFAGAGGATQGLVDAGFVVVGAVELDDEACDTYELNQETVDLVRDDITKLDPAELRRKWGVKRGELSLLKACPPCQGFSTLGPSDADDPRNDLLADVWRFVEAFRPRAFLLENVPGVRSDRRLRELQESACEAGYVVRGYDVDAVELGVPQRRRRHIVCGVLDLEGDLPESIVDLVAKTLDCSPMSVRAALRAAGRPSADDPLDKSRRLRAKTLERITAVPVGGNRFDLPKPLQLDCHKKLDSLGARNAMGPYGRMKLDDPAPTLTTRCTTPSCGSFVHPTEHRGLTLREAAILQTFPTTYEFAGGYDSVERQIGNAVPVRMAHALGVAVRSFLTR